MAKQKRQWFNIMTSADDNQADIFIYGPIGNFWWDDDAVSASDFIKEFKTLENKFDRINIRINSPGGSIWDGLPIVNAIKASKKDVHTYIDGIAYSMGFMIALAGHKVHAAKNALGLAHSASTIEWGNAKAMRQTADDLDKYDDSLATIVQDRTDESIEDIKAKYFDYEDHLMTAQELTDNNLIDVIEDYNAERPDAENMKPQDVFSYFRKADDRQNPSSFFDRSRKRVAALFGSKPSQNSKQNSDMFKNLNALFQAIKNGNKITDDLVANAQSDMTDAETGLVLITAEQNRSFNSLQDKLDALQSDFDAATNARKGIIDLFENSDADDFDLTAAVTNAIDKANKFDALDGEDPDAVIKEKDKKQTVDNSKSWSQMEHHQRANDFLNKKLK